MLSDLPPRFFCDFTVPPARDGTPTSDEYEAYVHWLADYLFQKELPLSQEQQDWLQQATLTSRGVIFMCADSYGFGASDLEFVESHFGPDQTYPQWQSRMREEWKNYYPTTEDREENPFDEWQPLSEKDYIRLHREWQQGTETGQEWESVDIPFRSLLGWAIRQIPEHEERLKELGFYFQNFHETTHK